MNPKPIICRKSYSIRWELSYEDIPSPSQVGYLRSCSRAPISIPDANQNPLPVIPLANNPTTRKGLSTRLGTSGTSAIRGTLASAHVAVAMKWVRGVMKSTPRALAFPLLVDRHVDAGVRSVTILRDKRNLRPR